MAVSDEAIRRSFKESEAGQEIVRRDIALYFDANGKTREKAAIDAIHDRHEANHVARVALDMCETYEDDLQELGNQNALLRAENEAYREQIGELDEKKAAQIRASYQPLALTTSDKHRRIAARLARSNQAVLSKLSKIKK